MQRGQIPPIDQFIRRRDVVRITGIPQSTLYSMMACGDFPPSYRLGKRTVAWKASEIAAWMRSRPAYKARSV